ncbi:putative protein YqeY [bioreactor metagenome]|uniref:GatB/YqeY domain-containing protein n=1 Tax=bioreactor metagenome TaxID=1076179 RepID=A0A645HC85_9ZZZZ
MISAIGLAEKEKGEALSKEEALKFIQKEVKQLKETIESTPSTRTDLLEEANKKLKILESYLPKQLSPEELVTEVERFIKENNLEAIKKNQGQIMKGLMEKLQGATDGKSLNIALSKVLK